MGYKDNIDNIAVDSLVEEWITSNQVRLTHDPNLPVFL